MNRTQTTNAIVLNLHPLGENNANVTLLTEDKGIVYATLYGGPKSKLRSLVSLWNLGTIYLYENPEKKQIKISDFDVKNFHYTFSQNLYKSFAASLVAEIAIKTRCGGSNEQCFNLISGFFTGMDLCNEDQSKVGLLRFLWRYLELLGVQPDATFCQSCGKSFLDSSFANEDISYYNSIENCFICSDCTQDNSEITFFPVKNLAVKYLAAISLLTPGEVRKLNIDRQSYDQIKSIVFFLIENNIDQKLNSLETGMGIL